MKKRLPAIADLLLNNTDYVTVNAIAKELKVSNKTIRNDLVLLEEWIRGFDLILDKKTGSGVIIIGTEKQKLKILSYINSKSNAIIPYSPEDRELYILNKLFITNSNFRIRDISYELHSSRATIHKDLLATNELLHNYKIQLVRTLNSGIYIVGKEKDIRKAIFEVFYQNKSYMDIKHLLFSPPDKLKKTPSILLFKEFFNYDFLKLTDITTSFFNVKNISFSDEALINFIVNLSICMRRVSLQKYINLSEAFYNELLKDPNLKLSFELTQKIKDEFSIDFPQEEVCYILLHLESLLKSAQIDNVPKELNTITNATEHYIADLICAHWGKILNLPLSEDKILIKSLSTHLKPILHRLNYGFTITNPILDYIKKEYPYTYKAAKEANTVLKSNFNITLNDGEIGYLTLHLVSAIYRAKSPLNTIIICHCSNSVSQLLKKTLSFEFNQLNIINCISSSATFFTDFKDIDLVLTTIEVDLDIYCPVVTINSLLTKSDIGRLSSIIKKLYSDKNEILSFK